MTRRVAKPGYLETRGTTASAFAGHRSEGKTATSEGDVSGTWAAPAGVSRTSAGAPWDVYDIPFRRGVLSPGGPLGVDPTNVPLPVVGEV